MRTNNYVFITIIFLLGCKTKEFKKSNFITHLNKKGNIGFYQLNKQKNKLDIFYYDFKVIENENENQLRVELTFDEIVDSSSIEVINTSLEGYNKVKLIDKPNSKYFIISEKELWLNGQYRIYFTRLGHINNLSFFKNIEELKGKVVIINISEMKFRRARKGWAK